MGNQTSPNTFEQWLSNAPCVVFDAHVLPNPSESGWQLSQAGAVISGSSRASRTRICLTQVGSTRKMSKEKKTRSELGQMILAELHALGIADVKRLVISENYETSVRYSWNILGWWRDSADEHSVARALERIVPRLQKQFDLDHA